jgi:hypothetical protein
LRYSFLYGFRQDLDGHQELAGVGAYQGDIAVEGVWELGGFQVPLGLLEGSLAGFKLWLPEMDAAVMMRSNIQQEGKALCYVCAQPSG